MPSGHDDAGAATGRQVLSHIVDEQDFTALALHREAVVRLDAALWRHERRVSEDNVGVLVPALLAGERVVLEDVRVGEAVQVQVHQRQAHHVGRDVVALEVLRQPAALVRREGAMAVLADVGLEDVLVRGDQEPGSTAGRVEHGLGLLGVHHRDDEVDDVARGAELPGVALGTEYREQVFEGVTQALGVVVFELVDDLEESAQGLRITIGQIGVLEYVTEERWDAGVLRHLGDGLGVEVQGLVAAKARAHQLGPAIAGVAVGEELAGAAQLLALGVHVVHELVDQCDGDLLDLALGVGHLAHEDVAGGVDAALCIGIEHFVSFRQQTGSRKHSP